MLDKLLKELQGHLKEEFDVEMSEGEKGPMICIYAKGDDMKDAPDDMEMESKPATKIEISRTKTL